MKKLISLLLVFCMVFAMTACGGETAAEEPAKAPANAPAAEAPAAEAPAAETFKIGMFNVMSGANAIYGEEAENAIKMVIDKMNAEGGLNGQQVEFVLYDDQASPEEAVKAATKLVEVDKINACIASCISSCVLATGGILNDAEVISFGTGLSPTFMAEDWPYMFRACVNSDFTVPMTVDLAKNLNVANVAIFRGQDESAIATANAFKKSCEEKGLTLTTEEAYTEGDADFSAQISRIINSKPDAVFMSTVGSTYGVFIKQLRQYGYEGLILNKEALPTDAVAIAGDYADYVAFAAPYLTYTSVEECSEATMKAFLQEYYDAFGAMPVTDSAYRAYDSMLVIWEGAKLAGSNDHVAIKDAINTISGLKALGGTLDYTDGTREGLSAFNTFIRLEGQNVTIADWTASGGLDAWLNK